ncbi:MAG TPA: DNA cytosine methyltransferase [Caulobacteraceae bacterium]|jgi:DNA (cytosine-5)-methyltransferase 1|nr:DNA cytosine methyltransferase [Caulobacteraceae bacterium]
MSRPFTFYEFFAGGGMARLGLGAGWDCRYANDFDRLKARTYRANFGGDHLHEGDVWAIDPDALPGRADLAWASSPCQDVSLAGARAGLGGARSSAFWGFWRLVEALDDQGRSPRVLVLENVAGLLSSAGGADFAAIGQAFAARGYRFGAVELNASAFLPQSRARAFVIAARQVPPDLVSADPCAAGAAVRRAAEALPKALRRHWLGWRLDAPRPRNAGLDDLLEPDDRVEWRTEAETEALLGQLSPLHRERLRAAIGRGERIAAPVYRRVRGTGRDKVQRAELRLDGLAGCLRTPGGGSSRQLLIVAGAGRVRSRWLTAREGARLMGLPEDYRLPAGATAAWRVIGDGVAVPVVRHLADRILEPLLSRPAAIAAAE